MRKDEAIISNVSNKEMLNDTPLTPRFKLFSLLFLISLISGTNEELFPGEFSKSRYRHYGLLKRDSCSMFHVDTFINEADPTHY